ncbi:hypothetical protein SAMN04515656_10336 [Eubacterium aggregans]|uniref:Uncharacterized protein n=1 Tax=Eubacterium aggregans TaxID=81409 RepID=A0A1H3Y2P8_9FIRM|nr:hypothetical protein [Eubacterium aggregans]SEA05800.1 hypothetical protein SAMN04515656_10336 [Eubacterium aggregans]
MIKRPVKTPEKKKDIGTFEKIIDYFIEVLEFGFPAYIAVVAIYASVVTLSHIVIEKMDLVSFQDFLTLVVNLLERPILIAVSAFVAYMILKYIKKFMID